MSLPPAPFRMTESGAPFGMMGADDHAAPPSCHPERSEGSHPLVILSEAKDLAVVILSEAKDLRFFTPLRSVQNDRVAPHSVATVVILSEAKDLVVVILSEAKDLRFFTALRSVQNDGVEHVALRSE